MTIEEKLSEFLQTKDLRCTYDDKPLTRWGYLKIKGAPQWPILSLRWWKQFFFGDMIVMRFHNEECYAKFLIGGKLK